MRLAPVWEWKFFLILHDKDLLDGSESEQEGMEENKGTPGLKKAHWHVVVVSGDRKSPGTIAIQLGIEKCPDKDRMGHKARCRRVSATRTY